MIAVTTNNGKLLIAAELDIPNGQNWEPGRIERLMAELERYVFCAELADKADLPKSQRRHVTLPEQGSSVTFRSPQS